MVECALQLHSGVPILVDREARHGSREPEHCSVVTGRDDGGCAPGDPGELPGGKNRRDHELRAVAQPLAQRDATSRSPEGDRCLRRADVRQEHDTEAGQLVDGTDEVGHRVEPSVDLRPGTKRIHREHDETVAERAVGLDRIGRFLGKKGRVVELEARGASGGRIPAASGTSSLRVARQATHRRAPGRAPLRAGGRDRGRSSVRSGPRAPRSAVPGAARRRARTADRATTRTGSRRPRPAPRRSPRPPARACARQPLRRC